MQLVSSRTRICFLEVKMGREKRLALFQGAASQIDLCIAALID
jgi:hypothetical protein